MQRAIRMPVIIQAKMSLVMAEIMTDELERMKNRDKRIKVTAVSTPKIKKIVRSEALTLENLPLIKCEKSEKTPGINCKKAKIRAEKIKIPKEVKTLMLKL